MSAQKDQGPDKLFNNAMEEILFGGGYYKVGTNDPSSLGKVSRAWNNYILENGWSGLIGARNDGVMVIIEYNTMGLQMLKDLGITQYDRQQAGIRSDTKLEMVQRIFAANKALGI